MCEQNTLIQFAIEFIEQKGFQIISYKLVNYKKSSTSDISLDTNSDYTKYFLGTITGSLAVGDSTAKCGVLTVNDFHENGYIDISGKTFTDSGLTTLPFQLVDQFFTQLQIDNGGSVTSSSSLSFIGYEFKLAL